MYVLKLAQCLTIILVKWLVNFHFPANIRLERNMCVQIGLISVSCYIWKQKWIFIFFFSISLPFFLSLKWLLVNYAPILTYGIRMLHCHHVAQNRGNKHTWLATVMCVRLVGWALFFSIFQCLYLSFDLHYPNGSLPLSFHRLSYLPR